MSAEIVYFTGDDVARHVAADGSPVAAVVDALRTLLEEAEAGSIRAIGFAIVKGSAAAGFHVDTAFVQSLATGWALESAARRLCVRLEREDD